MNGSPKSPITVSAVEAWTCLCAGALLLPFISFQTVLPFAAWVAPVLIMRFVRAQSAWVAIPALVVIQYVAAAIALRGIFPVPDVFIFAVGGVVGALPYIADKFAARRLDGAASCLVFPAASVTLEWLFSQSSLGTLGSPAYSQYQFLPLIQVASVTGSWGIVFLLSALAPVFNDAWERRFAMPAAMRRLWMYCALLAVVVAAGSIRLAFFAPEGPVLRVACLASRTSILPTNVPPLRELAAATDSVREGAAVQFRRIADDLFERTAQQARAGARLVLWSECAAFVLKEDEGALLERARELARQLRIYLQVGLITVSQTNASPFGDNRAVLFEPSGHLAWDYPKTIHPLADAQIFAAGPGRIPVITTPYGRLATVICFDADFPRLVAQAGRGHAGLLLVPAMDWFAVREMHARAATFRAVENGFSMVRSTGNGISIAVNALGEPLAIADSYAADDPTLVVDVPTRSLSALYPIIGDSFAFLCMAVLIFALADSVRRRFALRPPKEPRARLSAEVVRSKRS